MYLLDTNIILEILLKQEKSLDCKRFFSQHSGDKLYLSRFTLYSIGILLTKKKKINLFSKFIDIIENKINLVSLDFNALKKIKTINKKFNLDFDDAYQYLVCKEYNLKIVTLDKDFKKTDLKVFDVSKKN